MALIHGLATSRNDDLEVANLSDLELRYMMLTAAMFIRAANSGPRPAEFRARQNWDALQLSARRIKMQGIDTLEAYISMELAYKEIYNRGPAHEFGSVLSDLRNTFHRLGPVHESHDKVRYTYLNEIASHLASCEAPSYGDMERARNKRIEHGKLEEQLRHNDTTRVGPVLH